MIITGNPYANKNMYPGYRNLASKKKRKSDVLNDGEKRETLSCKLFF